MSHIRIYRWADAPKHLRAPFSRKRRQWIAHIPQGGVFAIKTWIRILEEELEDGSKVVAGNET